ncbi:2-phosphosulfolactate phosphatase [bacterium]|nr:2-phosphosulfolactate phosphatase [bacterium]
MRIDVMLTPGDWPIKAGLAGRVAVIDVLRASTSIITALSNGAESVIPASSPEEAVGLKAKFPAGRALLCGEREGLIIPGFDLGNSPAEYSAGRVSGKTLLFASTNGSRMIAQAARSGRPVCVAGFVNAGAVSRRLADGEEDILLACAGREGAFSLEDATAAGMLAGAIRRLSGNGCFLSDEARAAVFLYRHFAHDLAGMAAGSAHGIYLTGLGLGADIPACVSTDAFQAVPVLSDGALVAT